MEKLFILVMLFILFAVVSPAYATAQIGERLIYNGEERGMYSTPGFSEQDIRIHKLTEEELSASEYPRMILFSTACWRKYQGTWEIKDEKLYLNKIIGRYKLINENEPVFAEWVTGELRIPDGERLKYVHMGFSSVYERDIIVQVKSGDITGTEIIDNTEKYKENIKK